MLLAFLLYSLLAVHSTVTGGRSVVCFSSVLENYHVSSAFTYTLRDPEANIFQNLDK